MALIAQQIRLGLGRSSLISAQRPVATSLSRQQHNYRRTSIRAMSGSADESGYYTLNYKYVADILEKRGPYREKHLEAANLKIQQGKMIMAGAVGKPVVGALFIFKASTPKEIEEYVQSDPYYVNGLIPSYTIEPYTVVVGPANVDQQ